MLLGLVFRRSLSNSSLNKANVLVQSIRIDNDLKAKLERLSLISFQNEATLKKVEQTINSSDLIHQAHVSHLEPLYTLVENEACPLRQNDSISMQRTLQVKQVLDNASLSYENHIVAPMIGKRDSQTVEKVQESEL